MGEEETIGSGEPEGKPQYMDKYLGFYRPENLNKTM